MRNLYRAYYISGIHNILKKYIELSFRINQFKYGCTIHVTNQYYQPNLLIIKFLSKQIITEKILCEKSSLYKIKIHDHQDYLQRLRKN